MLKIELDKNNNFKFTLIAGKSILELWEKVWKEEFEKQNQRWKNTSKRKQVKG